MSTRSIGLEKENVALDYLTQHGLKLLHRNYQCKQGEIDLIMQHLETLIFIEVRYRHSKNYGGSAASISPSKQKHLIQTARFYLRTYYHQRPPLCRFDVIAINGDNDADLTWIRNAFYARY